jgi:alanyl-tRNA synthetase
VIPDYKRYRSDLLSGLVSRGFPREAHQPLAHPLILTNFTMSMAVPLLPERRKDQIRKGGDFCVIQPCIRIHDSEDFEEENDWWHLTFFEMAGAVIGAEGHRTTTAHTVIDLLTGAAGLDRGYIHFECFSGGGKYDLPEDTDMRQILSGLGVAASNLHSSEDQFFFSPSHEQAAGPMVEVFYFQEGKRLEIGTFATITHFYDESQRLDTLKATFTEFGLGIERLFCVSQGRRNLDDASPMSDLFTLVPTMGRCTRRLFADRLRATYLLLSEGLRPRSRSREKILRHWMRDVGRALASVAVSERNAVLVAALRVIHSLHADSYELLSPEAAAQVFNSEFERYDWWRVTTQ